jgi:hypothetical protein
MPRGSGQLVRAVKSIFDLNQSRLPAGARKCAVWSLQQGVGSSGVLTVYGMVIALQFS